KAHLHFTLQKVDQWRSDYLLDDKTFVGRGDGDGLGYLILRAIGGQLKSIFSISGSFEKTVFTKIRKFSGFHHSFVCILCNDLVNFITELRPLKPKAVIIFTEDNHVRRLSDEVNDTICVVLLYCRRKKQSILLTSAHQYDKC